MIGVVDLIMSNLYDPETGVTYGALSCCNNKDIASRCKVSGAPKKIWAILGSSDFNSNCALTLREELKQGQIRLLVSEYDADEYLQGLTGYQKLTPEDKVLLQMPYINTTMTANELIDLKYETKNNVIKVKENPHKRKDRYSSLSYNIYVSKELERELRQANSVQTVAELVLQFKTPKIRKGRL